MRIFFVAIMQSINSLLVLLIVISMLILLAGSALYFFEASADPDRQGRCGDACFSSILSACWGVVSAVTTVGYGDSFPGTIVGKVLIACGSFAGIIVLALPVAVFESNFNKIYIARDRCHNMVNELTAHQDAQIDKEVVNRWFEMQIAFKTIQRQEPNGVMKGAEDENRDGSSKAPQFIDSAIAMLNAAAIVQVYDMDGRGYLLEEEALMMMADVDEYHAPNDTTLINSEMTQIIDLAKGSLSSSLSELERFHFSPDYVSEQQKRVDELWRPAPLKPPKLPGQKRRTMKSLVSKNTWSLPDVHESSRSSSRLSTAWDPAERTTNEHGFELDDVDKSWIDLTDRILDLENARGLEHMEV